MRNAHHGVLNWFIRQAMDGETIALFGGGTQKRDITYIDDVVAAFLRTGTVKDVWGEVFNVGGTVTTLSQFVSTVIRLTGKGTIRTKPFPPSYRRIELGDIYLDWSALHKKTRWKPRISIEKGIRQTIAYHTRYRPHYFAI
jgi:UDP-glucose 4-epimerase